MPLSSPRRQKRVATARQCDSIGRAASLVGQFEKGDNVTKRQIYSLYLANTRCINNWDLVDISAPQIVNGYLETRNRMPLDRLAKSASPWERRIKVSSRGKSVCSAESIRKQPVCSAASFLLI